MTDLIRLRDVSKAYAGVPALRSASLAIAPGEIHALVGENGAGKSTLIKILAGVVQPDQASIDIAGTPVAIGSPGKASELGLRFIHQELDVIPALSVAENIFVGRDYPRRLGAFVDWQTLNDKARSAMDLLGIGHIDPGQKMARLGLGDQMLVRLSAAFLAQGAAEACLYVMDEPTASLNSDEAERLFAVLDQIRRSGRSVVYVTHRLDEVMHLCDRVTVMRGGETIATDQIAETTEAYIIRNMIGRPIEDAYPPRTTPVSTDTNLKVEELAGHHVGPVSFSVARGEIVGLAGLSGAGQSEVLRLLIAADARTGTITLEGRSQDQRHPVATWRDGFAFVPQERRTEGLMLTRSIADNVTLPNLARFALGGTFLNRRAERQAVNAAGSDVRLKANSTSQPCYQLSGGNQQKVVFARALLQRPPVLLLDEPTRGVDVGAKFDIYSLIRQVSSAGTSVLVASSDFPELLGLCDRILVFRQGQIAAELNADGLSEETLLSHCFGATDRTELAQPMSLH